jgi:predicted DNA-binding protein (MmcQ/YjbR family)
MRTKAAKNWNPFFRALWEHCRAKPLAVEDHPWGDTVFKVGGQRGQIFAFLSDPEADDAGVTVKPSPEELGGLLRLPYVQRAGYIGRYGWVDVSVRDRRSLKLTLGLIDETYSRIVAAGKSRTTRSRPARGKARPRRGST